MKKYMLLAFATLSIVACNKKQSTTDTNEVAEIATTTNLAQPKTEIAAENMETTEFKIEGMTCQMGCANTIKAKLEALNGVGAADVSFESSIAVVSFDKTVLKAEDIKNTVNAIADGKLYKVIE